MKKKNESITIKKVVAHLKICKVVEALVKFALQSNTKHGPIREHKNAHKTREKKY